MAVTQDPTQQGMMDVLKDILKTTPMGMQVNAMNTLAEGVGASGLDRAMNKHLASGELGPFNAPRDAIVGTATGLTKSQQQGSEIPLRPMPKWDSTRPPKSRYEISESFKSLRENLRTTAKSQGRDIENLLPKDLDEKLYEMKPEQLAQYYSVLEGLANTLDRHDETGNAVPGKRAAKMLPQESAIPDVAGLYPDRAPKDMQRHPEGDTEKMRNEASPHLPDGMPVPLGDDSGMPTKLDPQARLAYEQPEGFLGEANRKDMMQRLSDTYTDGRDMSGEKSRRRYLTGNGFARAFAGGAAVGGFKGGQTALDIINDNEDRAMKEYERPEDMRKAKMAEALEAISGDRTFANLLDKGKKPTVSYDGQNLDPNVAARNPELFQDADLEELREKSPARADILTRARIAQESGEMAASDLKNQKTRSEIAKNEATAWYTRRKGGGELNKTEQHEVRLLAAKIEKDLLKQLAEMEDGWGPFTKDVAPEDYPIGFNQFGTIDREVTQAEAMKRYTAQQQQ